MAFETTLDGLATRNTAGSGRGVWETRHCEPLRAALLAAVRAFKPLRRPRSGVYKAPHDPPLLKRSFPLARLVCHALLSLS